MITGDLNELKVDNLPEFRAYFEKLVECRKDLNYFIYGNDKDLLSALRSRIEYPCLMLYKPNIRYKKLHSGSPEKYFDIRFKIISACYRDSLNSIFSDVGKPAEIDFDNPEDVEKVNDLLREIDIATTENGHITEQVLLRIGKDFQIDECDVTPVEGFTADYSFGWESRFSIYSRISCALDDGWDKNCFAS